MTITKPRSSKKKAYYRRREFCMNERDRIRLKEEIPSAIKLEKLKRLIEDDEESVLDSVIKELILRME